MKADDLLKIGFKDTSFTQGGKHFTEHTFDGAGFKIYVSGEDFVELGVNGEFMPLHNVSNTEQIEELIKLLT